MKLHYDMQYLLIVGLIVFKKRLTNRVAHHLMNGLMYIFDNRK